MNLFPTGRERLYADRREGGRRLVPGLLAYKDSDPVVLGLARGGLAVGVEIAKALACPLEPVFVRKIGVPGHEELAAGAVVDGPAPEVVINADVVNALRIT